MSLADYFVLAVVILAAVGAILYNRQHPGCSGNCASCGRSCAPKDSDLPGGGPEEKSGPGGDQA